MILRCDKEGIEAVKALCDIALKAGGIQNLPGINQIMCNIHLLPPQETNPERQLIQKEVN